MLAIRLLRVGKKNQPAFKLVVTEKTNPPRAGRFLEELGYYNPLTKERSVNGERAKYWMSVGAKPSDTAHNLLVTEKVIEGEKIAVHAKAKKKEDKAAVLPERQGETPTEDTPAETSEEGTEELKPTEETPSEVHKKAESAEETPVEESKAEEKAPTEEQPKDEALEPEEKKEE